MKLDPRSDSTLAILGEPEVCGECHSLSRLTNGLCLNCLLRGALEDDKTPSGKEAFKEVLAGVKSGDGDWHIADHEILAEIARGGMGVVYQAREPHSDRVVALKCVLTYHDDSDHVVARFRREAETAARLEHPNIVPIYQIGETADGFPYFTMKYAAAGSLLQARASLLQHPHQSAALMVKVARAVHYAHEKGVLHRDLKPGNILLDSYGEPLVSDFGLARCEAVSSYLTRSLASFGTPGYIAPEQADGPAANLTPAADVYSLGAILFELLTGRTPFVGDNAFAVMKQSAEQPAPKLRILAPKADRDLEIICARCLEREPNDRYQSAGELADDLKRWLDDRPILAAAPGMPLRTRRWIRRNRTLSVALAALVLVGAGSLFWLIRGQKIQTAMQENYLAARSVAVLPFIDLDTVTGDPMAAEYVADSLRRQFENLGPARVVSSAAPGWARLEDIRKAARGVKGRAILTGTVRNLEGKRRLSFRLVDPGNGTTLFSTVLDHDVVRSAPNKTEEWAREIHKFLSADHWSDLMNSKADPGVRNEAAYDAMKAGRELVSGYTVYHLDQAISLYRKALAVEPNSALAHAYLAMAASCRFHFVADLKYLELGKSEALTALALAPNEVEAHRALAGVYYQEGKFSEALEQSFRTMEIGGVEENITIFLGMTLDSLGRPDEALSWYRIASRLQAKPGETEPTLGDSWMKLCDDEQALRAYDRASELQPGSVQGAVGKAHVYLLRGEFDAARAICLQRFHHTNELGQMAQVAAQIEFFARNYTAAEELYAKLAQADPHGGGSFYGAITYRSALGRIKQALGSQEMAAELLQESLETERAAFDRQPRNAEIAYRLAAVEAASNFTEAALQHLRQAAALGWMDYRSLQKDPRFDSLRSHPELDAFMTGLSARVAELKNNANARDQNEKQKN
ncbi:MAG: protein kinase [Verrucomicrobiota bacterium]|nr:protein kinase [Verrucomicrobiota bacterium]